MEAKNKKTKASVLLVPSLGLGVEKMSALLWPKRGDEETGDGTGPGIFNWLHWTVRGRGGCLWGTEVVSMATADLIVRGGKNNKGKTSKRSCPVA